MTLIKRLRCAALFVLLTVGALQADAQSLSGETLQADDLTRTVRRGAKTTYFDLLRQLFPDLQEDATAHKTIPLRSILEPREKLIIEADITFNFNPYWINSEGRRLLLLWVELTDDDANQGTPYQGGAVLLAVFRLEPSVKLLDAMRIESDRFTHPWGKSPIRRLTAQSDAFMFINNHWNSGENYNDIVMLFVDAGRFKTITSQFIYNFTVCGATISETPSFRIVADPDHTYPQVLVKVKVERKPAANGCDHRVRAYTLTYQGLYRWNKAKARYEGHSRQLDRLDKFNEKWLNS